MENIYSNAHGTITVFTKLAVASGISILSIVAAQADVTLKVDDNIKVTEINGKPLKQSPFQPLKKEFTLQPGKHIITAKYDKLYEFGSDRHDYLRSGNITVTGDLIDNQTYQLIMPGQPERYYDAKQYAKNPKLAIVKGGQIIAQEDSVEESGGILSNVGGWFGGGDSAQSSNQKAIAAVNSQPNTNTTVTVSENASTLDKFMQVWLQATPEEREKIRMFVAE